MKHGRRAELLSAVLVASMLLPQLTGPALASQMKQDSTVAHIGTISPQPMVTQEVIGERKFQVAKIEINAKPDLVWSALVAYDRAAEIFSNLKRLSILSEQDNKKKIKFSVVSMGGLMKYDYVLNITEKKDLRRIEWERHSGAFKSNDGFWQLTPTDGGQHTMVTYAKYIDGGMLLPQTIVNSELKKVMPEVLTNLRNAVMKDHQIALSQSGSKSN